MNKFYGLASALALLVLLTACGSRGPLRSYQKGTELAFYDFSNSDQFEQGTYGTTSLLIRDGKFRIDVREGDNELWWGQWGDILDNTVIEVDVEQLSERPENAYGVMCRVRGRVGQTVNPIAASTAEALPQLEVTAEATESATREAAATERSTAEADVTEAAVSDVTESAAETSADSTEAAVSEDATETAADQALAAETEVAGIATEEATEVALQAEPEATEEATREATPEALPATVLEPSNGDGYLFLIQGGGSYGIFRARGRDLTPLVNWQISEAINPGLAQNHLRVVCFNDYLALSVNDQLVAETTDDSYQQGQVGLVASAATRLGASIEFDNLSVSEATPG